MNESNVISVLPFLSARAGRKEDRSEEVQGPEPGLPYQKQLDNAKADREHRNKQALRSARRGRSSANKGGKK
jgi:hypothetical protein